jgi:hypothetical protein
MQKRSRKAIIIIYKDMSLGTSFFNLKALTTLHETILNHPKVPIPCLDSYSEKGSAHFPFHMEILHIIAVRCQVALQSNEISTG